VPITSACHTTYASSNHSGFLNAPANAAGNELPVEPEVGCEPEPEVDPEEREPDAVDPPAARPLPDEAPPDGAPDVPPHADEDEEDGENEDADPEEEKPRSGRAPAGCASESTNTSPRMCSTYWAGTPGGLIGCVNTTCTPVAVTVISPAFELLPRPNWSPEPMFELVSDGLFEVVDVPPAVPP
jgi:hypothetical protein